PAQVRAICRGEIPAWTHASFTAPAKASRAQASPTRWTLLLDELPTPNCDFSSPTTQRVLVPPPSIPKKNGIKRILTAEFANATWIVGPDHHSKPVLPLVLKQ